MTIDGPYKGDWLSYIFSITYVDSLSIFCFYIFVKTFKFQNWTYFLCLTSLPDEIDFRWTPTNSLFVSEKELGRYT